MKDPETASWIAALERARAELEGALRADMDAYVLVGNRARNPVYRCWEQLNRAIDELRQAPPVPARRRVQLREALARLC
ncbi:MAG: hypothetical protein J2P50_14930, partial [Hyphomicrobiaceae bacterium]|nr:hypothetical protein [Hyphomicrobiaceae bacterium]